MTESYIWSQRYPALREFTVCRCIVKRLIFKPHSQSTNTPSWSRYISYHALGEIVKESRKFILGDHCVNSCHLSLYH